MMRDVFRFASSLLSAALLLLLGSTAAPGLSAPQAFCGLASVTASAELPAGPIGLAFSDDRADDREEQLTDETAAPARSDPDRLAALPARFSLWPSSDLRDAAEHVVAPLPAIVVAFRSRAVVLPPSQGPPLLPLST